MDMPRILMCPPDHYGIEYEINPWMNRSLGAVRELAFSQWKQLRDTLVSLYFSLKVSHPLDAEGKRQRERETLESLNPEDGLLHVIETQLAPYVDGETSPSMRESIAAHLAACPPSVSIVPTPAEHPGPGTRAPGPAHGHR